MIDEMRPEGATDVYGPLSTILHGSSPDDAEAAIGVQLGHRPNDTAAPVVSTEYGFVDSFGIQHPNKIVAEILHVVFRIVFGTTGETIATLVGHETTVPRRTDSLDLMTP